MLELLATSTEYRKRTVAINRLLLIATRLTAFSQMLTSGVFVAPERHHGFERNLQATLTAKEDRLPQMSISVVASTCTVNQAALKLGRRDLLRIVSLILRHMDRAESRCMVNSRLRGMDKIDLADVTIMLAHITPMAEDTVNEIEGLGDNQTCMRLIYVRSSLQEITAISRMAHDLSDP